MAEYPIIRQIVDSFGKIDRLFIDEVEIGFVRKVEVYTGCDEAGIIKIELIGVPKIEVKNDQA